MEAIYFRIDRTLSGEKGEEEDILDEETDGVAEVTIEVARSGCTELFSPGLSPRNPLKM
jgi:hypothetical protein